jgi:hypothetical protein
MIQTVATIKPTRVIEAERTLEQIQSESFEAWKARQSSGFTGITVEAGPVERPALTLGDLQSPRVAAPSGWKGRINRTHERLNAPRVGVAVRMKQGTDVSDYGVEKPRRDSVRVEKELWARENRSTVFSYDWEDDSELVIAHGMREADPDNPKPVRCFVPGRLSRKRLRDNTPSKKQLAEEHVLGISVRKQADRIARETVMVLCADNVWRPKEQFRAVAEELPQDRTARLERIAAELARNPVCVSTGLPNVLQTHPFPLFRRCAHAYRNGFQYAAMRSCGPVRPPVVA